jgi:hypothetical protein
MICHPARVQRHVNLLAQKVQHQVCSHGSSPASVWIGPVGPERTMPTPRGKVVWAVLRPPPGESVTGAGLPTA